MQEPRSRCTSAGSAFSSAERRMNGRVLASQRRSAAWRPEWPLAILASLAWVILLLLAVTSRSAAAPTDPVAARTFMICPIVPVVGATSSGSASSGASVGALSLMAVAMMTPATLPAARHVAFNSFRRRRYRALLLHEVAFVVPFVVFSGVALAATSLLPAWSGRWVLMTLLIAAAGWQVTTWKRRAVLSCGRTVPLPPAGVRADIACLRFGFLQAMRCMSSTWALMLLVPFAGRWHLPAMGVVTAIMVLEERPRAARPIMKPVAVVLVAVAGGLALGG